MSEFLRKALLLMPAAAVLGTVRVASACAVCSAGRDDETRLAFIVTTVLLSVLPLGMIGGAVWWIARQDRRLESKKPRAVAGTPHPAHVRGAAVLRLP